MRSSHIRVVIAIGAAVAVFSTATYSRRVSAQAPQLGTIEFATSGAAAAQPAFLEGVKELHSFQFDEAGEAFRKAQQADPGFAMAYWGEAMSYNHPLWAQVDVDAAKRVLTRLAPTAAERVAKAKTPREKGYLEAVNTLYFTEGDKLARDVAYSDAMKKMYAQWPNDHEVATFYALSVLGTVRPGDKGFRRQALAASIVLKIFEENPSHPGAAHFIIHAFDDPDHAILALPAARAYAKIAPSAAHALHMPSHIFVQLGMWQDVANSNEVAYKAAHELNARMKLPEGREDFHTLGWLEYANLMMGKFDEAKNNVQTAKETADRNPSNPAIRDGYLSMQARYLLESGEWQNPSPGSESKSGDERGGAAGSGNMGAGNSYGRAADWAFINGVRAAKLGDAASADRAEAQLRAMREEAEASGNAYAAKPIAIREKEVAAASRWGRGQKDDALKLAKDAADIELTMNAPSGPPEPIKPALEFYGDMLLDAGRTKEAAIAYEQSLLRTPNRTPSVKGLAKANPATRRSEHDGAVPPR